MKKFLTLTLATVALTAFATAQTAGPLGGAPGAGRQAGQKDGKQGGKRGGGLVFMQKALERLDLNTDQKSKLKTLADKFRKDMKALREAPGTREEKGPKMRESMKAMMKDVEAILTPEQRTKFSAYLKEERTKMRKNRGGGTPPPAL